jgi:hypothetical protein
MLEELPKQRFIAIVGVWLLMGILGYIDHRAKAKDEKDICSSPFSIFLWPFLAVILSPLFIVFLFLPVFIVSWSIDFLGARVGLSYLGDALVLATLVTVTCILRIRNRSRTSGTKDTSDAG